MNTAAKCIALDTWAGRRYYAVEVVGETPKKARIRVLTPGGVMLPNLTRSSRATTTGILKDFVELWMRDDLIETLRDCANALGELSPCAGRVMTFDDFSDQVEAYLMQENGWTELQLADFISPRTRRLIQAYQDGDSVAATAAILLSEPPAHQNWD